MNSLAIVSSLEGGSDEDRGGSVSETHAKLDRSRIHKCGVDREVECDAPIPAINFNTLSLLPYSKVGRSIKSSPFSTHSESRAKVASFESYSVSASSLL